MEKENNGNSTGSNRNSAYRINVASVLVVEVILVTINEMLIDEKKKQ